MEDDPALCENYKGPALTKNCCEDDWYQISIKDYYTAYGSIYKAESNKAQLFASDLLPIVFCSQMAPARFITAHYKSPPGSHEVFLPFIQIFLV